MALLDFICKSINKEIRSLSAFLGVSAPELGAPNFCMPFLHSLT